MDHHACVYIYGNEIAAVLPTLRSNCGLNGVGDGPQNSGGTVGIT